MKNLHALSHGLLNSKIFDEKISPEELGKRLLGYIRQGYNPKDIIDEPELADMYYEQMQTGINAYCQQRSGWLYLCKHPMQTNIYKFGCTKESTETRAKTLRTAGVLGEFEVVWHLKVWDMFGLEAVTKQHLHQHFLVERELVHGEQKDIISSIKQALEKEYQILDHLFYWHIHWPDFEQTLNSNTKQKFIPLNDETCQFITTPPSITDGVAAGKQFSFIFKK